MFVITKADLSGFGRRSPEGVVSDLRRLFPDWFKPGNNRLAMVCPVSVVDGTNLECPLIFAAWATLIREYAAADQRFSEASSKYDRKYDGGFFDDVAYGLSELFDTDYKKQVDALYNSRNAARERVDALADRLRPLAEALVPMVTFRDGKEMTDDEKRNIYSFS